MSMALKASKANQGRGLGGGPLSGYGADAYNRRAYMGDPGLFGFLGKAVGSVIKSTPLGAAASALGGAIVGRKSASVATPSISGVSFPGIITTQQQVPRPPAPINVPGPIGGPGAGFPMPFAQGGRVSIGEQQRLNGGGPAPSGYHWNKSDYFLKDGTFVPKGTKLVKNRRRNPLNPRAASRAISRLESAKKATKRLNRITIKCRRCGYSSCKCK